MQRYFIEANQFTDTSVMIMGDDARHLTKVLRVVPGYQLIVSDGAARDVLAEVETIQKDQITARIIEQLPRDHEPDLDVVIAQSLPKADKLEMVIQKCTEIGAAAFYPFTSERTVVQYDSKKEVKKLERWNKIAKEAAEQAGRNIVPQVHAPVSMKELLASSGSFDQLYVCYEKGQDQSLKDLLQQLKKESSARQTDQKLKIMLIIGPEGGFSEDEISRAEEAGCKTVGLGKRILRTETAPIAALSCVLYEFDQMGG